MNNKKGLLVMSLSLIVVMLIALAIFYVQISGKTYAYTSTTGKVQSTLLQYHNDAQKSLLFIDQSARFALQDSIFALYEGEGFDASPRCSQGNSGSKGTLWEAIDLSNQDRKPINRDKTLPREDWDFSCYPSPGSLKESFKDIFNRNLDIYLLQAPHKNIPLGNYDFTFIQNPGGMLIKGLPAMDIFFPSYAAWRTVQKTRKPEYKEGIIESLPADEQGCLRKPHQYPLVRSDPSSQTYSVYCQKCPKKPACSIYNKEQHCTLDPCSFNCIWEKGRCSEFSDVIYTLKPSFAIEVQENPFARFEKIVSAIKSYKTKFIGCILRGGKESAVPPDSGKSAVPDEKTDKATDAQSDKTTEAPADKTPNAQSEKPTDAQSDDILAGPMKEKTLRDAEECLELLKEEKDFKSLSVAASQQQDFFSLGFTIPLSSFKHPYRSDKPEMNIGLQFWDIYPPAKVPSFRQENNLLVWEKSPSSDVGRYPLFAMEKGAKECGPSEKYKFFGGLEPNTFFLDPVGYFLASLGKIIGQPEIGIVDGKEYCFAIAPEDKAGNVGEISYSSFIVAQLND